ncbi:DUF6455 family protein [Cognatishimia maritima]|uniref:DUF6455 domain-containing protein n=1 Tax=Cognatishimia maritima TaxID=870908 RepID=A0A1M5KMM0_9RHOB|nr:DUF6455 family protein [Cognatishimia maritima]SHG54028.1 hypothetical protein SAMN04488044_1020 [Cognatishimia maritima]
MNKPKTDKSPQTPLKSHVYLFDMMAEKLGKRLEGAVIDGDITADQLVAGVYRCSACTKAEDCAARLPSEEDLQQPYEYCRNQALFAKV